MVEAFHVSLSYQKGGNNQMDNLLGLSGKHSLALDNQHFPPAMAAKTSIFAGRNNGHLQQQGIDEFTKRVLSTIAERASYANSEEEIEKMEGDSIPLVEPLKMRKRSEQTEQHVGGCVAQKVWVELPTNHYPRFIKSYNCSSENCHFGKCRGKTYTVKVLKKNSPDNPPLSDDGCDGDQHLPEELRCGWKLVPVPVTIYCECLSLASFGR